MEPHAQERSNTLLRVLLTIVDIGSGLLAVLIFLITVLANLLGAHAGGGGGWQVFAVLAIAFVLLSAGILQCFQKYRIMAFVLATGVWLVIWCADVLVPFLRDGLSELLRTSEFLTASAIVSVLLLVHGCALYFAVKARSDLKSSAAEGPV
jgi:hypothetical protein